MLCINGRVSRNHVIPSVNWGHGWIHLTPKRQTSVIWCDAGWDVYESYHIFHATERPHALRSRVIRYSKNVGHDYLMNGQPTNSPPTTSCRRYRYRNYKLTLCRFSADWECFELGRKDRHVIQHIFSPSRTIPINIVRRENCHYFFK